MEIHIATTYRKRLASQPDNVRRNIDLGFADLVTHRFE